MATHRANNHTKPSQARNSFQRKNNWHLWSQTVSNLQLKNSLQLNKHVLNICPHTKNYTCKLQRNFFTEKFTINSYFFFLHEKYSRNSHLHYPTSDTILSRMTKSWLSRKLSNSISTENLTKFNNKLYTKFNNVHQYINKVLPVMKTDGRTDYSTSIFKSVEYVYSCEIPPLRLRYKDPEYT